MKLNERITRTPPVQQCPDHDELFCVQPGIAAGDALVHAVSLIEYAQACNKAMLERDEPDPRLVRCNEDLLALAKAAVESLIEVAVQRPG